MTISAIGLLWKLAMLAVGVVFSALAGMCAYFLKGLHTDIKKQLESHTRELHNLATIQERLTTKLDGVLKEMDRLRDDKAALEDQNLDIYRKLSAAIAELESLRRQTIQKLKRGNG